MNVFLSHLDFMPIMYGVLIFAGLYSMWSKIKRGQYVRFLIELSVFIIVFKLHGGTMAGGFAATIAALLAGFFMRPRQSVK